MCGQRMKEHIAGIVKIIRKMKLCGGRAAYLYIRKRKHGMSCHPKIIVDSAEVCMNPCIFVNCTSKIGLVGAGNASVLFP